MLKDIDTEILKLLKESNKESINETTYSIAKKLKISWSTANIHLLKLKTERKVFKGTTHIFGKLDIWTKETWNA